MAIKKDYTITITCDTQAEFSVVQEKYTTENMKVYVKESGILYNYINGSWEAEGNSVGYKEAMLVLGEAPNFDIIHDPYEIVDSSSMEGTGILTITLAEGYDDVTKIVVLHSQGSVSQSDKVVVESMTTPGVIKAYGWRETNLVDGALYRATIVIRALN